MMIQQSRISCVKQKFWNFNPQQIPWSQREYPKGTPPSCRVDALDQPPSKQFSANEHVTHQESITNLSVGHFYTNLNHSWYRYLKNLQEGIFGKSNVLIQWRTLSGNWKRIHAWYLILLRVRWLNWPSIARSKFSIFFGARRSGSGVETRRSPQVSQGMPRHWRNGWVNVLICFCLSGTLWWVHPKKKASSNLFCLFIFRCGFHLLKQVCKSSTMNRKREIRFFGCGWMDRTMRLSITFQKSANIAILSKGTSHHLQCHLVGSQGRKLSHFKRRETDGPKTNAFANANMMVISIIPSWDHPNFKMNLHTHTNLL